MSMNSSNQSSDNCSGCNSSFGTFFNRSIICPISSGGCGKHFCSTCLDYACVTETNLTKATSSSGGSPSTVDLNKLDIECFCKSCFQKLSNLDFSTSVQIYEPKGSEDTSIIPLSVLFLHGGGGCRKMFDYHAQELSSKHGYRCVLIDLPGHGACQDDPLTMDTALEAIHKALETYTKVDSKGRKPVIIGGSLGGYLLMEYVGRYPDAISAGIVTMCGQNVGEGRGWAAGMGIFAMSSLVSLLSSKTMLSGLIKTAASSGTLNMDLIVDSSLRTGMFFHQGVAMCEILSSSNPSASLSRYPGRLLFVNGSKDHRDSEQLWLSLSQHGSLKVYEGGDHFFSHDNRFLSTFLNDIVEFIEK